MLLGCKLELQRQNSKLPPEIKGYGMLEPYAMKVASTVLRREGAGNRSFLFDRFKIILQTRQPIFTNHHLSTGVNDILCIDTYYIKNKRKRRVEL